MLKSKAKTDSEKAQKVSRKAKTKRKLAQAKSRKARKVSRKAKVIYEFSKSDLEKNIIRESKIIKIPAGEARSFVAKVAEKVAKWTEKRAEVTEVDINRQVAKEIEKYSKDLAFVYKNKGKII